LTRSSAVDNTKQKALQTPSTSLRTFRMAA